MENKYSYRKRARLLMIPVALVIGVLVGILVRWDAGLLAGVGVFYLAPELFLIFSKKWRKQQSAEQEMLHQKEKELFEELEKKYPNESSEPIHESEYIDEIGKEFFGVDEDGFIPMN